MKKFLTVFALFLSLTFVSCGTEAPVETVSETEAVTEENAVFLISMEDITKYSLVRSEDASDELISAASDLYKELRNISTAIKFKDDYFREDLPEYAMGEYEILVGATNRPESAEFIQTLRTKDYGYTMLDGKIVIAGATDEYTAKAVKKFLSDIVNGDTSDGIFYSEEENFFENGSYPLDSLTIAGVPVQDYAIVYPESGENSERLCAESLTSSIAEVTGYLLNPVPDSAVSDGPMILVGMTAHTPAYPNMADDESYIGVSGTTVQLGGNSATALLNAVGELTAMFEPKEKNVALELTVDNIYKFDNTALTAMSFNILYKMDDKARMERVYQIIRNYLPDTFGVQEATPQWMKLLEKEFGELYDFVGEGRDGGDSGEYSAIFYNKTKFSVLDSGTKWLSDTPDRVSKVPESSLNRIFTYALMERLSDGLEIMIVNTHFEHTSDEARDRQAEVLRDFLLEYTDEYPLVLTGDFNTTYGSDAFAIVQEGGVTDSMGISEETSPGATFTSFGSANSIIDFIFVTEDSISVRDYRVCNEKIDGEFPSDHHPVLIEYIPIG